MKVPCSNTDVDVRKKSASCAELEMLEMRRRRMEGNRGGKRRINLEHVRVAPVSKLCTGKGSLKYTGV